MKSIPFEKITPFLLLGAGVLLYFYTLPFHFVYDDNWTLLQNQAIQTLASPLRFFTDPTTAALPSSGIGHDVYRPFATLSFALNHALFGFTPAAFRFFNIALHILNALLLYFLIRRRFSWIGAGVAALIFLWHPLQVESVVWVTQRSILLCTTFVLVALILWERQDDQPQTAWLIPFAYLFALLSKETALGLPLLLALWQKPTRGQWKPLALLVGVGVLYMAWRAHLLETWSQPVQYDYSISTSLAEGFVALGLYVKNIFWPFDLNVSYKIPMDAILSSTYFWLGLIMLFLIFLSIVHLWKEGSPLLAVPLLFFVFWLPHSGVVPLVTFAADRFLYLPLLGVAFLTAWLYERHPRPLIFGGVVFFLFGGAFLRTLDWRTEKSLWAASLRENNNNAFAHACYAQVWREERDYKKAVLHYETALKKGPTVDLAEKILVSLLRISDKTGEELNRRQWEVWLRKAKGLTQRPPDNDPTPSPSAE